MSKRNNAYFTHTVLFWLNEEDNEAHHKMMQTAMAELIAGCEYPIEGHAGKPAGTDREVVDGTYHYSLLFTFDSKEAQDKYQAEPAHEVFIKNCKHIWKKVQVYDSINIA